MTKRDAIQWNFVSLLVLDLKRNEWLVAWNKICRNIIGRVTKMSLKYLPHQAAHEQFSCKAILDDHMGL